jgi:chemotaxis signal transduction protein
MDAHNDSGLAPHVVVRVGAARIGIPADCVQRALSAPEQFAPLPRRHGALLGVLPVDGQPVLVIDIACWVALDAAAPVAGAADDAHAAPSPTRRRHQRGARHQRGTDAHAGAAAPAASFRRVVLLCSGERMAAVRVDALEPLAALPASAIVRLCHDDDAEQLFHSAAILPDSGETIALLNVDNLFDLSHSWCSAAGIDASAASATEAAAADTTHTWALLQAGGERLALRAEHVAEVIPMPELEQFMGASGVALCRWRDGHLAVLPLARLLGAGAMPAAPLLAVLRLGEHTLGLPINAVCELRQLPADPQGVRADTPGRMPCLSVTSDDGETLRLIDTQALFAMHPEAALNLDSREEASKAGARRNEETYVVVDACGKLALPIGAFEEVLHAEPEECRLAGQWRSDIELARFNHRRARPASSRTIARQSAAGGAAHRCRAGGTGSGQRGLHDHARRSSDPHAARGGNSRTADP